MILRLPLETLYFAVRTNEKEFAVARILLVNANGSLTGDEDLGTRVSEMLTAAGHEVVTALTVKQARARARERNWDLVVVLGRMPDTNRYRFIAAAGGPPAILADVNPEVSSIRRGDVPRFRAQQTVTLRLPFEPEELQRALDLLLPGDGDG
ncbi:MAG: hypothetical protein ACR2RL_04505 [Gammaproteobacteria bacterium]